MSGSLDLDDLLELWEHELEEDGARLDVMPPPLPDPVGSTRIIGLSFKALLSELVRKIPARDPVFDTWFRYSGFYNHLYVYVFDPVVPVRLRAEFCSSGQEYRTSEDAEEKVSEMMIRILEKSCKFEIKDLNWEDKRRFHCNSYNSCIGFRQLKEENELLKIKVKELGKGWRHTLEGLDQWCDLVPSAGFAPPEEALPVVLYEGISEFERVCEKY